MENNGENFRNGKLNSGMSSAMNAPREKLPSPALQAACIKLLEDEIGRGTDRIVVVRGICAPGTLTKWLAGNQSVSMRHAELILAKYGGAMDATTIVKLIEIFKQKGQVIQDLIKVEESANETAINSVERQIGDWAKVVST